MYQFILFYFILIGFITIFLGGDTKAKDFGEE